ncbi:phosphatase PAP2 family protein [Legionella septentrionalis]|uniref:hypothetical protein n=1 Tax=Legionella septentrionalis TaxID=2498109 RepID=UPI000F8C364E|nr:hypothetical protein [Legionella septentrionalis]RUQ95098.1 hypothetical protein ELY11_09910 [Legionella septentrionalis]
MFDLSADILLALLNKPVIIIITILGAFLLGQRLILQTLCLIAFGVILNVALKGTFQIPHSPELSTTYVFPSGHMQVGTMFYLWWALYVSWLTRSVIFLILLGIGLSLIHYHFHTLVDVAGGFFFGMLAMGLYRYILLKNFTYFPWCFWILASLLMLYNTLVYHAAPPHAWMAYYYLSSLIFIERMLSWNGRFFSGWQPVLSNPYQRTASRSSPKSA